MPRPEARLSGEFYPTPEPEARKIAQALTIEGNSQGIIRLFDPCAGEGIALHTIAEKLRVQFPERTIETWAVEISPDRAEKAKALLDRVVAAPFEQTFWSPKSAPRMASFILFNPPYDWDAQKTRYETAWLRELTENWTGTATIICAIVPYKQVNWSFAEVLTQHYEVLSVSRLEEFEPFKQVCILARKLEQALPYNWDRQRQFTQQFGNTTSDFVIEGLPTVPRGIHSLPICRKSMRLYRKGYSQAEIAAACAADETFWRNVEADLFPKSSVMEPILEVPAVGHVAGLVSAGVIPVIHDNGQVFKGRCLKMKKTVSVDEKEERIRDVYRTHVSLVTSEGYTHLDDPLQVASFLQEHAGTFRKAVIDTFTPYGDHATEHESKVLATIGLDKALPGCKLGLLPKQKQDVIALCRALEQHSTANLIAKMGYGKTRIAAAVADVRGTYPVLITCPPNLPEQWKKEIEDAVPGAIATIVEDMHSLRLIAERYVEGQKLFVIITSSRIRLGPGWGHQVRYSRKRMLYWLRTKKQEGEQTLHWPKDLSALLKQNQAVKSERRKEFKPVDWSVALHRRQPKVTKAVKRRRQILDLVQSEATCPTCGAVLIDGIHFKAPSDYEKKPVKCNHVGREWDPIEREWALVQCGQSWKARAKYLSRAQRQRNSALYQFDRSIANRWPLADYIRRYLRTFFKFYIADEVHKSMAKGTQMGWFFGILAGFLPTLTLTGTYFGGKSKSIFYLLYRTCPRVRREFGFHDSKRWIERYGVWEQKIKFRESDDPYHAGTARAAYVAGGSEQPGLSPEAYKYLLPNTVFGRIADLGIPLPDYDEQKVGLDLGHTAGHIKGFESWAWSTMLDNMPIWTAAWFQWVLARPNSCFREEEVTYPSDVKVLPAQVNGEHKLLNKEAWLVDKVKGELREGRRVIVYPRQTATRDIQPRLKQILVSAGVQDVTILGNVSARKRNRWLAQHGGKVLITNPKKVALGMNLQDYGYCTIIFYEVEYSLYVLWQAMSRVHRPGQTKDVRVFFTFYEGTIERKALKLIGEKMMTAQLLYGDDVTSALVADDGGDSSFVLDLIRAIKAEEPEAAPLTDIFGSYKGELMVSESVLGSPIAPSRTITIAEWLKMKGMTLEDVKPRKRRKKKPAPIGKAEQMSLF